MTLLDPEAAAFVPVATQSAAQHSLPLGTLRQVVEKLLPGYILLPARGPMRVHKAISKRGVSAFAIKVAVTPVEEGVAMIRREYEAILALKEPHPNIREVLVVMDTPHCPPFAILEFCRGTLYNFQSTFDQRKVPEAKAKELIRQLLSAAAWLHAHGLVHRDLHPKHIMITGAHEATLKVIDLSKSIRAEDVCERYMDGNVHYRPPDVHLGAISYGSEYDMWSVGCIFAEMMSGRRIFKVPEGFNLVQAMLLTLRFSGSQEELKRRRRLQKLPWTADDASWPWYVVLGYRVVLGRHWSPKSGAFINGFLQFDPEARVTAAEALKSPYLAEEPSSVTVHPPDSPASDPPSEAVDGEEAISSDVRKDCEEGGAWPVEREETSESVLGL